VVFAEKFQEPRMPLDVSALTPLIVSWTNDAEIFRKNWKTLGVMPVGKGIVEFPTYKVMIEGRVVEESFDGSLGRTLSQEAAAKLTYRTSNSPMMLQDVASAYYGYLPWQSYYDELLVQRIS